MDGGGLKRDFQEALAAANTAQWEAAERKCRAILHQYPEQFETQCLLGDVLLGLRRPVEALAAYESALKQSPDNSQLYTRCAFLRFRIQFGAPPKARVSNQSAGRIQVSSLGSDGRFGNQLLQYAFGRLYCEQHSLELEVPDWIGRDIYDLDDAVPLQTLPTISENEKDLFASLNGDTAEVFRNVNLSGYFCAHTSRWGERSEAFRKLFTPGKKVRDLLSGALGAVKGEGKTLIAVHLRRGDFGYGPFWVAPPSWYEPWVRRLWDTVPDPVLYIASDDETSLGAFADYSPWHATRTGVSIPGAEFLIDYYILQQADYLAVANSTFSFTAAMLNTRCLEFVRPDPVQRRLTRFEPWNSLPIVRLPARTDDLSESELMVLRRLINVQQVVVHLGNYCSRWTNAARAFAPSLRIVEMETGESVDSFRRRTKTTHVTHLVIEEGQGLSGIIGGAREALRHARIDFLHFHIDGQTATAEDAARLAQFGYVTLQVHGNEFRLIRDGEMPAGNYMAVHQRLYSKTFLGQRTEIDIPGLCSKYGIRVSGVLHVGAHVGEEVAVYETLGATRVVFLEANPQVYERLVTAMREHPIAVCVNRAISDRSGQLELHLASFDQSSSLLPLGEHRRVYPAIASAGTVLVRASTLDDVVDENGWSYEEFNLLNVDVQGAEAMVLRGAAKVLPHIRAINIEVNFAELYRGGAQIEEIESILQASGFRRVAIASPWDATWGDAFYVRGK